MSYPIHQVTGGSAARTVRSEKGFWGLELSESALERGFSRAMDTENLIWAGDALKKRPGYRKIAALAGRINGIFAYKDMLIVHAGTGLYRLEDGAEPVQLDIGLKDAPSMGVVSHQSYLRRRCVDPAVCQWSREQVGGDLLFLSTGREFVFTDGQAAHPVADEFWGIGAGALYEAGIYQDYYAAVPFTVVAKDPETGVGDADPRGDNRLSQFRCESFYVGDTEVYEFPLNCHYSDCNLDSPPEIRLRDSQGAWRCLCSSEIFYADPVYGYTLRLRTPGIKAGMALTCVGDTVTALGSGDHTLANDGMDNLRITYGVKREEPLDLIRATVQGLFGADGADNVLFLGGGSENPGEDGFSARNDFFCFYETSVERLGDSQTPITGYCRLSDGRLAVLKNEPNGAGVYFRDHTLVTLGTTQAGEPYQVDAFPSKAGAAVEGCVSPHSVGFAGNEPCFLASSGLYSVRSVSNELTNLNETVRRSAAVDPLLQTLEAAEARSIRWQSYYLLTFGRLALITDGRRDSGGSLRFLKWTLGHAVTALGQKDTRLYLGDAEGKLYRFGGTEEDDGLAFCGYWHTPLLEDTSGRRMILRRMWAAVSPGYNGALSAAFYRDRVPKPVKRLAMHLMDFADWDFGAVSFEGSSAERWVALTDRSDRADAFSLRLELTPGLLLWGFRMIYEKGGMMR